MKTIEIPVFWIALVALVLTFFLVKTNVSAKIQEPNEVALSNEIELEKELVYAENQTSELDDELEENTEKTIINVEIKNYGALKDILDIEDEQTIPIEDVKISRDMDLTIRTGLSKTDFAELINKLKQDSSGFFKENAEDIYDLCREYQINELFFCGLIAEESGWSIASNHRRTHNYISLMGSNGLIKYNSVYEGLEAGARVLHNNYLEETGRFYHGKTIYGVKRCFCPASDTWAEKVFNRMQDILRNAK